MIWACLASAIAGLSIGLKFRAPFLLAATTAAATATVGAAVHLSWSLLHTITVMFLMLAILQIAYLIGLAVSRR